MFFIVLTRKFYFLKKMWPNADLQNFLKKMWPNADLLALSLHDTELDQKVSNQ